ncbi:MAG TPA: hypothetical protein PLP42_15335 [Acidobacteriota bacterium]|nr:hypothetical protein [Acidobacteriota bacterium]
MDQAQAVIVGMVVAYFFAFLGMAFAWIGYYRRKKEAGKKK